MDRPGERLLARMRGGDGWRTARTVVSVELTLRLAALALLVGGLGASARLRLSADRVGGAIPRSVDPGRVRIVLAVGALLFYGSMLAWIVYPPIVARATMPVSAGWRWAGLCLMAAGIGSGLWALRHLGLAATPTATVRDDAELVTSGPYRWVRHPLYSSMLLTVPGCALASANLVVLIGGSVTLAALLWRTRWEEAALLDHFGDPYREYMDRTGRIVPRVRREGP